MGVRLRSKHQTCCGSQNNQVTLHIVVPPLTEPILEGNPSRQTTKRVLKSL
jgi:hypothetical protein